MEEGKQVGKVLKEHRQQRGLSLKEVSERTKIPLRYLRSIENCRYEELPSTSYAQLYVRNYADFLGLSVDKFSSLFRRDLAVRYGGERSRRWKLKTAGLFYRQNLKEKGKLALIRYRPIATKWIIYFLPLGLILLYLLRQYLIFTRPPKLDVKLSCVQEGKEGRVVRVEGRTDPNAAVKVEGELVVVRSDGSFSTQLFLPSKSKRIQIFVEGINGKRQTKKIPVKCKS